MYFIHLDASFYLVIYVQLTFRQFVFAYTILVLQGKIDNQTEN